MVLVGDDDLVALGQERAQRMGQHIGVLAGRGAEMHLVVADVQAGGDALIALVHQRPGPARDREGVIGLDFAFAVELGQAPDRRLCRI